LEKTELILKRILQEREGFFRDLTYSLITSAAFVLLRDYNFPPKKEDCEYLISSIRKKIIDQGRVFELDKAVSKKGFKDLANELDKYMGNLQEWPDLSDKTSFAELFPCTLLTSNLYHLLARDDIPKNIQFLTRLGTFGNHITSQGFELIGYWAAKMEESKRIKEKTGGGKTKKKRERIKELEKELTKYFSEHPEDRGKISKGVMAEARKKFPNWTDRTLQNWLKELNKEQD